MSTEPLLKAPTVRADHNVIQLRGRVKNTIGAMLIIELEGGRFYSLPKNQVQVKKHRNPKKRDYITVMLTLAQKHGLIVAKRKDQADA